MQYRGGPWVCITPFVAITKHLQNFLKYKEKYVSGRDTHRQYGAQTLCRLWHFGLQKARRLWHWIAPGAPLGTRALRLPSFTQPPLEGSTTTQPHRITQGSKYILQYVT